MTRWSLVRLGQEVCHGEARRLAIWLVEQGLLRPAPTCRRHRTRTRTLVVRSGRGGPTWYCSPCGDHKPAFVGSIFAGSRLDPEVVLLLA